MNYKNEKDTLTKEKLARQIEELEFIYQTTAKQDSITLLLSKEIALASTVKNQRLTLILTVLSLLFVGVLLWQMKRQNQLKTKANKLLAAKNEKIKTLLWEVHHRVKNNLLFISSLLDMQADSSEDHTAKQALTSARDRIETMSLLHQRLLYKEEILASVNIEEYLTELLEELKMVYKGDHSRSFSINLQVDDAYLDLEQALPLGLIVNELVTNAIKHANIPEEERLVIDVYYQQNDLKKLIVHDNGQLAKVIRNPAENSFGTQLVDLLIRQLKGKFSISNDAGLRYEIIF
jgi:two-component sensor histidine kinase